MEVAKPSSIALTRSARSHRESATMTALGRGLMILDAFSEGDSALGVNEIARRVGMYKSTVSRLCATLENAGYLERDPQNNRFRLGARIFQLSGSSPRLLDVRIVGRPALFELVEKTRETATLTVRDHDSIVTADAIEGLNYVRMGTRPGMKTQIHASAAAKAILAWTPEDELETLLSGWPMTKLTPHTMTDPKQLRRYLQDVRVLGYALDMEEMEVGLRCVGAPIRDHLGRVGAAVAISGPRHRMTEDVLKHFAELVRGAADQVAARLGAPPVRQSE